MNISDGRATALVNALNDGSRTRIGDPWRGSYHVGIDITDEHDTAELRAELDGLGVTYKVNLGNRDRIAIYEHESLKKLLELGDALTPRVYERLQKLVWARGPVPEANAEFIRNRFGMNWSAERIAAELNRRRVTAGMGGKGWTPRKVKDAARGDVPARLRKREAA